MPYSSSLFQAAIIALLSSLVCLLYPTGLSPFLLDSELDLEEVDLWEEWLLRLLFLLSLLDFFFFSDFDLDLDSLLSPPFLSFFLLIKHWDFEISIFCEFVNGCLLFKFFKVARVFLEHEGFHISLEFFGSMLQVHEVAVSSPSRRDLLLTSMNYINKTYCHINLLRKVCILTR